MKKIITISRQFGAGAGEIGQAIARILGYEYYDKEIILRSARETNLNVSALNKWDERVAVNIGFAQSLFDFYNRSLDEKLFEAQSQVIKQIAEKGNCVIVGRNANSILKYFDSTLHVLLTADEEWRIDRMLKIYPDTTRKQMTTQLHNIDKQRAKYCSYYTKTEFGHAENYDVCLNTGRLGIEQTKDTILSMACESLSLIKKK